jgi:hypothetical protein
MKFSNKNIKGIYFKAHFHVEELLQETLIVHEVDPVQPSKHEYLHLKEYF